MSGRAARFRAALTGRFIGREDWAASPETTVGEATDPVHSAARELLIAYEGDDTGRTQPLKQYFEQLRHALNS